MPIVLDDSPGERAALYLWTGSAWVKARSDADGHFQVDILSSALPTGAATQATLASILAQLDVALSTRAAESGGNLDLIQTNTSSFVDMRGPLGSVATDVYRLSDPRERTPVKVTKEGGTGNIAPHGATQRFTYTVPVGKKAIVESMYAQILRITAATALGLTQIYFTYTPSGGVAMFPINLSMLKNAIGDEVHELYSGQFWMHAGDVLTAHTIDASTGGTVKYSLSAGISEFNA